MTMTSSLAFRRASPLLFAFRQPTLRPTTAALYSRAIAVPARTPTTPFSILSKRTMSSARDTSDQSDITKMKVEADGSFKRKDMVFRNFIKKGGEFEPEAGA